MRKKPSGKDNKMIAGELNILIVAEDCKLVAGLSKELVIELAADVSIVDTLEEAMVLTASNSFDVIVASSRLSDGSGMTLLAGDEQSSQTPVIILEEAKHADRILDAIRFGAADVFTLPLDSERCVQSIRRASKQHRQLRTMTIRTKRLRKLTSRLVKDRRELRQRVDLICRDLVQAYQQLAQKVVDIQTPADAN